MSARVLLIAPSLDILGGQAVQADRLLRRLRHDGVAVDFLPMNPRLPGPLRLLQRIKYVRTAATVAWFCALLLTRGWRYEVLHIFSASFYSFLWAPAPALLFARLTGKRSILNYRDGQAEEHLRDWRGARALCGLADRIVSPSAYVTEVFRKHGLAAETIPNVIDATPFRYRERRNPRPVFLHNRILEPLYNVDCTLRAFALIQGRYPNARLTLAHDGPSRPRLERLASELSLRDVRFIGKTPQARIADLYDEHDIYLTSPNTDCMPGSLLECFASGLPVIATRAGGIPHLASDGQTALLVDLDDAAGMAEAAFRLLEEDGLAARIAARAHAELRRYQWDAIGPQWRRIYGELTGAEPAARLVETRPS